MKTIPLKPFVVGLCLAVVTLGGPRSAFAQAPPTVTTQPATAVFITGATLNGSVCPNGVPGTYAWFEWGADTNYGNLTAPTALDSGSITTNSLSQNLPDILTGGTIYHFRAAASNAVATVYGGDLSFTTPPVFHPVTLHEFTGGNDGGGTASALVQGGDGYFYGTTESGGTYSAGTFFRISSAGAFTTLYAFKGTNDGTGPSGLVQGSDGDFYGTMATGGTNDSGTVFKISAGGTLTTLYSFAGADDGSYPVASLIQGFDGSFYGGTELGGAYGYGTLFKISTNGGFTTLHDFQGWPDGASPTAGLVRADNGDFYGTTRGEPVFCACGPSIPGSVFKITPDGVFTALYTGGLFYSGLVQGGDGDFYGTTYEGGASTNQYGQGFGTVFKISASGTLTTLHTFAGTDDGSFPVAALIQGFDGSFYGTTLSGGTSGAGTMFELDADGTLTTLYSFTGGDDGGTPDAALVRGTNGLFYGATSAGGANGFGTIFVFSPPAPPLLSAPVLGSQGASLSLPTQNGVNYVLEYKNALTDPSWTPAQTIAGNGLVVTFTDADASVPSRFYRVRVAAP